MSFEGGAIFEYCEDLGGVSFVLVVYKSVLCFPLDVECYGRVEEEGSKKNKKKKRRRDEVLRKN